MGDSCNKKSFWCVFSSIVQPVSLLVLAACAVAFVAGRPTPPEGGRGSRIAERGDGPRADRPGKPHAAPEGGSQKD